MVLSALHAYFLMSSPLDGMRLRPRRLELTGNVQEFTRRLSSIMKCLLRFSTLGYLSNDSPGKQELPVEARGDAVSSMVYEADARVRDPVYGCVGAISSLQQQVAHLQTQLAVANAEIVCMRMHNTESSRDSGNSRLMQGSYQQGLSPPLQPQSPELHNYYKPTAHYYRTDNMELAELLWT